MAPIRSSWVARHGDTSHSPIWALVSHDGQPIDLDEWTVRAQLRDGTTSLVVVHAFTPASGVFATTATVELSNGRLVETGAVQLVLAPIDWNEIPSEFSGILDVEIASDTTPTPDVVYTVALVDFSTEPDVTRWYDPDNLESDSTVPPFVQLNDDLDAIRGRVTALEAVPGSPVQSVNMRTGNVVGLAEASDLSTHVGNQSNPHQVTKSQLGLGAVDNTSDTAKPISNSTSNALLGKVDKSVATAKGDLWVATAAAVPSRLGIGSDGQVLTADSSQTVGVRWGAQTGGSGGGAVASVNGRTGAVTGLVDALTPTAKSGNYTAAATEFVLADVSSSGWTLTLPTTPADKTRVGWKIVTQATSPNTLTVSCSGSDRFTTATGPTSLTAILSGQAGVAQYQASTGLWLVQSGDLPLTQLDSRYTTRSAFTNQGDLLAGSAGAGPARLGVGGNGQVLTADSTQAMGLRWVTPSAGGVTSVNSRTGTVTGLAEASALAGYVPTTQRGPLGGVAVTGSVTGMQTPDVAATGHLRWTLTGDITVTPPTSGVEGQQVLLEVAVGTGANRTVTFSAAIETSQAVPGRVFTVPSSSWGYFTLLYRASTWRLVSAEPQALITVPTLPVTSAWLPADHGLLGWTSDPALANGDSAVPTSGYLIGSALKIDQAATVSNVIYQITVAGAGFTTNRNFVGLYDATGNLLASTPDQTGWNSVGIKTSPFTTAATVGSGAYYLGLITTASTLPTFACTLCRAVINQGRSAMGQRAFITSTVYTSLPATRPAATGTVSPIWFGLA